MAWAAPATSASERPAASIVARPVPSTRMPAVTTEILVSGAGPSAAFTVPPPVQAQDAVALVGTPSASTRSSVSSTRV